MYQALIVVFLVTVSVDAYDPVSIYTTVDIYYSHDGNDCQATMNSNHWVASNRISANSTAGVVDENAKVWNTNNLVSIISELLPPNLNYPNIV